MNVTINIKTAAANHGSREAGQQAFVERTGAQSRIDVSALPAYERVALGVHEFRYKDDYVRTQLRRFDDRMEKELSSRYTRLEECKQNHINAMRLLLTFTDQDGRECVRHLSVRALINQRLTQHDYDALCGAFVSGSVQLTWHKATLATIKRDLGRSDRHLVASGKDGSEAALLRPVSGEGPGEVLADLIHRFAKAEDPNQVNLRNKPTGRRLESHYEKTQASSTARAESRKASFSLLSEYRKKFFLNQEWLAAIESRFSPEIIGLAVSVCKWVVAKLTGWQLPQPREEIEERQARLKQEICRFRAFRSGVDEINRMYNPFRVVARSREGSSQLVQNVIRQRVKALSYSEIQIQEGSKEVTTIAMKICFSDKTSQERTLFLVPRARTKGEGAGERFVCDLLELVDGRLQPIAFSGSRPRYLAEAFNRVVLYSRKQTHDASQNETQVLGTARQDTDRVPVVRNRAT